MDSMNCAMRNLRSPFHWWDYLLPRKDRLSPTVDRTWTSTIQWVTRGICSNGNTHNQMIQPINDPRTYSSAKMELMASPAELFRSRIRRPNLQLPSNRRWYPPKWQWLATCILDRARAEWKLDGNNFGRGWRISAPKTRWANLLSRLTLLLNQILTQVHMPVDSDLNAHNEPVCRRPELLTRRPPRDYKDLGINLTYIGWGDCLLIDYLFLLYIQSDMNIT